MHILTLSSEWPTEAEPMRARFIVRQVEALRAAGVNVDVFPFRGGGNPLRYARLSGEVRARIRGARYDLVHAQFGQSALLAIPKLLPLVVTYRGSDLEGIVGPDRRYTMQGKILSAASRMVARLADEIILVSDSLTRFVSRRDYTIIPSGIDLDAFSPMPRQEARRALGMDEQKFTILFAANPKEPIKQFWLAEEAVAIVRASLPGATLVVASGERFERIPLYMNACDALLLTSAHEGSPNVVKEALACNLPVVATRVGDVAQRLASIEGCHVCDQGDANALAAALLAVHTRNGRVDSRSSVLELDEANIARRVIEVYERALRRD
jgi:glycosyltransferase involved in cell wall biosynthesis